MEINEDHRKILAAIDPLVRKLTLRVNDFPDLYFTGFIYKASDPPMLMTVGNLADSPEDTIRVHWILSHMAANMHAAGAYTDVDETTAPTGPDSLAVADRLVLSLLAVPVEAIPDHIQELVQKYADSRRPEKA